MINAEFDYRTFKKDSGIVCARKVRLLRFARNDRMSYPVIASVAKQSDHRRGYFALRAMTELVSSSGRLDEFGEVVEGYLFGGNSVS